MYATGTFYTIKKYGMKNWNLGLTGFKPGFTGQVPQSVHHLRNIDIIRTTNAACMTGGANPNRLRAKNFIPPAVLNLTADLIGENLHGRNNRAACGPLLALIACLDIYIAFLDDFFKKGRSLR